MLAVHYQKMNGWGKTDPQITQITQMVKSICAICVICG